MLMHQDDRYGFLGTAGPKFVFKKKKRERERRKTIKVILAIEIVIVQNDHFTMFSFFSLSPADQSLSSYSI